MPICTTCKKPFTDTPGRGRPKTHCSAECRTLWKHWQGFIHSAMDADLGDAAKAMWRGELFATVNTVFPTKRS